MSPLEALGLGVVEGLTELLPVSSTGHLILVSKLLGQSGPAADALDVTIQLGAVLAVVVHFRARLVALARGLCRRDRASWRLFWAITAGFVPTGICGLALHGWIKQRLFGPLPVAAALAVGGLAMLVVEKVRARRGISGLDGLEQVTVRTGLWVGLAQCLALWPGASRSMTTIVGGQLCGLSTKTAAELSFLLSIPTLGAATLFDLASSWHVLAVEPGGLVSLGVGMGVSFFVAWAVVALFLRYVPRIGLSPFAYYRLALALAVVLLAT